MPEVDAAQPEYVAEFETAKSKIADWFVRLGREHQVLTEVELRAYASYNFTAGWRFPLRFSDGVRRIELLLPIGFPWQPPQVALLDRPPFLEWPHVERNGLLCLATDMLEVDANDPAGSVACMLDEATQLVESLIKGALNEDFQNEFLSYWAHSSDDAGQHFISLLRAEPPTRLVRIWRGKTLCVLAENDTELETWLANRFGKMPGKYSADRAALLWLETPPTPKNYPRTGQDLRRLAMSAGTVANDLLSDLVRKRPDKITTVLGYTTANGPAIAGVVVSAPSARKYGARDPLTKGYRQESIPDPLLLTRYLTGSALKRRSIDRADHGWVHGRGQDCRAELLRDTTVAVIGCGSVGAPVAIALAQAGVGHLILIDFDKLKWANIGRHPLGAAHVNHFKSKALADKLRSDFPYITVTHLEVDADTAIRRHGALLAGCQILVSATGCWAADGRLDAWRQTTDRPIPIVYGWLEAHACAGHALLLDAPNSSLRSGFDNTGVPHFQVSKWPKGPTIQHEPACGAAYQPYGPIELGFANSLIAELALGKLLGEVIGPAHRIWVGPQKRLLELGGCWSTRWGRDFAFRAQGSFVVERAWPIGIAAPGAKSQAA